MNKTPVLVTGGAGYIGSHVCKSLAQSGYLPVTYDNLSLGHKEAVKWGPLEVGDIADKEKLSQVLRDYSPAAVLHFAAFAYVGESVENPAKYYMNNVAGTLNLLDSMLACGVANFVFSSTCATYGIPEVQPITELTPQAPINPYGMTKLMVERVLQDYASAYGLRAIALRYFNACGADPDGEIGEDHDPETHVIPRALLSLLGNDEVFQIFGTDYATLDGTCIRDYIHVADLATGHVLALQHLLGKSAHDKGSFTPVNLGTGRGISVRELVDSVQRVTGKTVPVREMPRRPGDPPTLLADPSRARELLGFNARYIELDEIISTAWQWYSRRT